MKMVDTRLLSAMLMMFVIAQVLGVFTGLVILQDIAQNPYVTSLVVTTDSDDPMNAVFFTIYILLGAASMLLLIRLFGKLPILIRIMEFMLISSSSSIVIYAFLRFVAGFEISTLGAILIALAFSGAKMLYPRLKNAAAVMATAGVGVIFGISLGLVPLVLFLILLSIYDFLSVFLTRHMVEMAEFVVKKDVAFTITARAPPPVPGAPEQRLDLGTGDMIAPIMLEVSALSFNPVATVFVFVGAVVSLGLFLLLVFRKKMVLPALPPIVLGMIVSLMIGFLLGFY
ncbi:MAG: presenilin family intramembrane aspartyl protease [Candidatus Micrarchaeota archaeon]